MIELKLTKEEANLVLLGLLELPAKVSYELIKKIEEQGQTQLKENNNSKGD